MTKAAAKTGKMAEAPAWQQRIAEENPEALSLDGFDDAVMGIARRCGQPTLLVYSADKCIQILMRRDKMTYDSAVEYFEFNTAGAWFGPHTPIIFERID